MPLQYFAGQRLTADDLQKAVPDRVTQGMDQDVTSSITLVDSSIAITVEGLSQISLRCRHESGGGGIRWAWDADVGLTCIARTVIAAGSSVASGSIFNIPEMAFYSFDAFTGAGTMEHFTTSNSMALDEDLVVEGSGTLTFQFAQETSNAAATTLHDHSYAVITRLGS